MVRPVRHCRQTKGADTRRQNLTPPRHISTLPDAPKPIIFLRFPMHRSPTTPTAEHGVGGPGHAMPDLPDGASLVNVSAVRPFTNSETPLMEDTRENQRDYQSVGQPDQSLVGLYRHLGNLESRVADAPFRQPMAQGTRIMRVIALMSGMSRWPATIKYCAVRYGPSLAVCVPDLQLRNLPHRHTPIYVLAVGVADSGDASAGNRKGAVLHGWSRKRQYAAGTVSIVLLMGAVAVWITSTREASVPALRRLSHAAPLQQSLNTSPQQSLNTSASSGPAVSISSRKQASPGWQAVAAVATSHATRLPATATSPHPASNHVRERHFISAIRPPAVLNGAVQSGTHAPSMNVHRKAGRVVVHALQNGTDTRTDVIDSSSNTKVESALPKREIRPPEAGDTEWMSHLSQRRITEIPDKFLR